MHKWNNDIPISYEANDYSPEERLIPLKTYLQY